jgi:hypothetical protein
VHRIVRTALTGSTVLVASARRGGFHGSVNPNVALAAGVEPMDAGPLGLLEDPGAPLPAAGRPAPLSLRAFEIATLLLERR